MTIEWFVTYPVSCLGSWYVNWWFAQTVYGPHNPSTGDLLKWNFRLFSILPKILKLGICSRYILFQTKKAYYWVIYIFTESMVVINGSSISSRSCIFLSLCFDNYVQFDLLASHETQIFLVCMDLMASYSYLKFLEKIPRFFSNMMIYR